MAMSVQPDFCRHVGESVLSDSSRFHFAHQKLIIEQTVLCQFLCHGTIRCTHNVRILVAEGQDTRRFNTHERRLGGNQIFEQTDVLLRIAFGLTDTAFGDSRPTALRVFRNNNLIAQTVHQLYERMSQAWLIKPRKLIEEKINLF